MRMVDGGKRLEVRDEQLHFIDAVVVEDCDFLSRVEVSMDVNLVAGFRNT